MKPLSDMTRLELAAFIGIGEESVRQIDEITTSTGVVRIISPTASVTARLSWYHPGNDKECLELTWSAPSPGPNSPRRRR